MPQIDAWFNKCCVFQSAFKWCGTQKLFEILFSAFSDIVSSFFFLSNGERRKKSEKVCKVCFYFTFSSFSFEKKKKDAKRRRNVCKRQQNWAFGCAQHPKVGQNTQHIEFSKLLTSSKVQLYHFVKLFQKLDHFGKKYNKSWIKLSVIWTSFS